MSDNNYKIPTLDPTREIRPAAYCWIVVGRLGNPQTPHTFVAARVNWVLDKNRMRLVDAELAIAQAVPSPSIDLFLDYLHRYEQKVKEKNPARLLLLADVTRSVEIVPALWRKTPDAIPIVVTTSARDEWSFPLRLCGRPLLLSRLQLWINDRKLVSSLPEYTEENYDPNLWDWNRIREALSSTTTRPPKNDQEIGAMPSEDQVKEDLVLNVAQIPWWAELEQPTPYADDKTRIRSMGK